jgi:hypothetical protein
MLQRLMASHVLTTDEAQKLFDELNDITTHTSVNQCWKDINASLSPAFGLEIATVSLNNNNNGTRYHAVINQHADDEIAKQSFKNLTPHVKAYIRLVLEFLVEHKHGSRMDLINLRTKVDAKHKALSIQDSELALDNLIDEFWLICSNNKEHRRASMNQQYMVGPRSYLELGHLLKDFGMEEMPQIIYHRS